MNEIIKCEINLPVGPKYFNGPSGGCFGYYYTEYDLMGQASKATGSFGVDDLETAIAMFEETLHRNFSNASQVSWLIRPSITKINGKYFGKCIAAKYETKHQVGKSVA